MKALIAFYILALALIALSALLYTYNPYLGWGLLVVYVIGFFYFIDKNHED